MGDVKQFVPQLRFPEFEGEWVQRRLDTLGIFYGGGTPESGDENLWNGQTPWISSSDIVDESIHIIHKTRFITNEAIRQSATKIIPRGSVLIVSRVGVGKFAVADEDLCTSQDFTNLICKENEYFTAYYFKARLKRFIRLSQGTSIKGITTKDIKAAKLSFPQLPEQQKIATFLTTVDVRIQFLKKKKSLLEQYKKGLMQRLFAPPLSEIEMKGLEDETNLLERNENLTILKSNKSKFGQLRFKDDEGREYLEWEEKRYDEIFKFHSTNSLSRENLNYETGRIKNIHYGDIHTKFRVLFKVENEIVPFVNVDLDLSKPIFNNYCQIGDIVVADASEDYNDIGKTIEIIDIGNTHIIAGLHTILARPEPMILSAGFIGYYLQSWVVRKQVMTTAQGTKVLGLSTKRLGKIKLSIPSLPEQTKIANFLTAIDKKIELINSKIEKTREFKKGLLQQMFV